MEWFEIVCGAIILLGSTLVAIKTIFEWFGKPIRLVKKKSADDFDNKVVVIIKRELPALLLEHDKETRKKYLSDRENYLKEISNEVHKGITQELVQVKNLTEQYEALAISARDVLREKIMALYHKNKTERSLTEHEKEALDQYYKDYKNMNGNSYIDKYYARMSRWAIIPDDYGDEDIG